MNLYLTAGTLEYLSKIVESNPGESMEILANEDGALLLHETNGKSIFKEPRKYVVLESSGVFGEAGFAAINTLPVTDEGRPLFEFQMKDQAKLIEAEPGLLSIRVLRPLSSQSYLVVTIWEDQESFQSWKSSSSYLGSFSAKNEAAPKQKIFSSAAYVETYSVKE